MTLNDRIARGTDETAAQTAAALGALGKRFDDGSGNGAGQTPVRRERTAPPVDQYAELKGRIHRACIAKLGTALYTIGSTDELATLVKDAVAEELAIDRTPLSRAERVRVAQEITDDILGHGPLEPFLRDDSVTEIMVNGAEHDLRRARGPARRGTTPRSDDDAPAAHHRAHRLADRPAHRRVARRWSTPACPTARRVNAIIPPLALDGPMLTIRKFARDPFTVRRPGRVRHAHARHVRRFSAACVAGKLNILVSRRHRHGQDDDC